MDILNTDFPCPKCTSIDHICITNDGGIIRSCIKCNLVFNIRDTNSKPKQNLNPTYKLVSSKQDNNNFNFNNFNNNSYNFNNNKIEKPFL